MNAALRKVAEAAREFHEAHHAVEDGLASFDLHNAAVARLKAAEEALLAALKEVEK